MTLTDAEYEQMLADHRAAYDTLLDLKCAQVPITHDPLPEGLSPAEKCAAWNARPKIWPLDVDACPVDSENPTINEWLALPKKQRRTLAVLVLRIARGDSTAHDDATMGRYEFKSLEIERRRGKRGVVWLRTEIGMVGDEGTAAQIFCRTRRHISISWRGGVRLVNAARYVKAKDGTITKKSAADKRGVSNATISATT